MTVKLNVEYLELEFDSFSAINIINSNKDFCYHHYACVSWAKTNGWPTMNFFFKQFIVSRSIDD